MIVPAFADEAKTIHEVRLTMTEPEIGAAPDTVIVSAEPEKYTATVRYWIKRAYPDEKVEAFEADVEYAMVFDVAAVNGYQFETPQKNDHDFKTSPTVVYLNGKQARSVSAETETKLGRSYIVLLTQEEPEDAGFFAKIINAIKSFFAGILNFFRNLF
ncbi:MAG: hypothetical protein IJK64_06460 [Clostridia bacterium]|nr:hypothetical protein [Clostridia bacterium]